MVPPSLPPSRLFLERLLLIDKLVIPSSTQPGFSGEEAEGFARLGEGQAHQGRLQMFRKFQG
jgi:hypothetical protein